MTGGTGIANGVPSIVDRAGYAITLNDLEFLGLTVDQANAMKSRTLPLGMSAGVYQEFVESLRGALHDEGATDADVRIQGSSVKFFSGHHKSMPWDRDEIEDEYLKANGAKSPLSAYSLNSIVEGLTKHWPDRAHRPEARPFDALYRVGVHNEASDYDVQISSFILVEKVRAQIRRRGVEPTDLRVNKPTYNFVKKEYSSQLAYLAQWAANACELAGRPVTVAVFDGGGPPDVRDEFGELSSHFRNDDDWILFSPAFGS
ncbi:hypothetical protein SAMN04487846_3459 [Microbacterium sp. cf046]|uniref:hypothetical protein n=1 Tax=Microbacterium sp. cf046 TaxID=1761803 RepID=UPI0008F270C4|nr:hypothetical protein [Microbacterium sp. cf046]SFS17131.1 hypothetical protein SAMN04487846_3459 [Microbacterium sp. cf046]